MMRGHKRDNLEMDQNASCQDTKNRRIGMATCCSLFQSLVGSCWLDSSGWKALAMEDAQRIVFFPRMKLVADLLLSDMLFNPESAWACHFC